MLEEENQKLQLSAVLMQAINEENMHKKLRLAHICLHALPDTELAKQKKFHKDIDMLITNEEFMRKLLKNSKIKENIDVAIEYLGKDYKGGDENFDYDQEFEIMLIKLHNDLDKFLGEVLKEISKGEEAISFNTKM